MVASLLAVGQHPNLPRETRVTLVTSCMFGAGIGTLVASLGVGFIGPRLPIVMGIWAPLIGQIAAIAKESSLGANGIELAVHATQHGTDAEPGIRRCRRCQVRKRRRLVECTRSSGAISEHQERRSGGF
jgi:hypothetical protein